MKNKHDLMEYLKLKNEYEYDNENFLDFLQSINFKLDIPFIHVAGSNGKSIVSNLLNNVYYSANYKVGLFSYNQFDILKSIKINNNFINIQEMQEIFEKYFKRFLYHNLNCYEVIFFISLVLFKQYNLDLVILDCYMGGEFDFTNIDEIPQLCIINNVELEHSDFLGRSKSEIAYNKGGIIKKGCKVVINQLDEECEFAINEIVKKNKATLYKVNEFYNYDIVDNKLVVSYYPFKPLVFNNCGLYNRYNIATLLQSIEVLNDTFKVSEEDIQKGLNSIELHGYFEVFIIKDKTVILDNAHNASAFETLSKSLNYYIKGKISAIVAIDNNKNVEKMLGILQKHVNKLLLTTYDDENARDEEGFILFKDDYKFYKDYKELFNNLLEDEETNTILICGSEVFVYQFYNYLKEIL